MPKPILKKVNLISLINENINLMNELNNSVKINFNYSDKKTFIMCDTEQINRVFINLLKNSIESIEEKMSKKPDIVKKIDIEIDEKDDYIETLITDNGTGFDTKNLENILKPYFTTKKKGTGMEMPLINNTINDHNGTLKILPYQNGAKIKITIPKNVN